MEKQCNPIVVRRRVELIVPYNKGEISHIFPAIGPDSYRNVGKKILDSKLSVPTGDYTASLLHAAYCSNAKDVPEFKRIRDIIKDIIKDRWLWVFQNNLWSSQGVYVVHDLEAKGLSENLDIAQLEKMLKGSKEVKGVRFSQDNRIRFAPKGSYSLGEHTPESLTKDGFIIASYGERGAEQLGEVASTFNGKPYVYCIDKSERDKPTQGVAALDSGCVDGRLSVRGGSFGDSDGGRAFGVLDSG